jgi:hypothetical protein
MKLTQQERAVLIDALAYFSYPALVPPSARLSAAALDRLRTKIRQPDFEVGDQVLCSPLNLPNGERAPNRNFEEPFIGTLIRITHDIDARDCHSSCLVMRRAHDGEGHFKDSPSEIVFSVDIGQLSHPEDS